MNFTKPTKNTPSLLTFDELETFLHEFGHALHGIFAKTRYSSLSGTNVYWDFVELPSQFMENYASRPEFLHTFAKHYQTGEDMPQALIDRIHKAHNFNAAYACMRQVSFGILDMAYYTLKTPLSEDIREFEHKAWASVQLLPSLEEACIIVINGQKYLMPMRSPLLLNEDFLAEKLPVTSAAPSFLEVVQYIRKSSTINFVVNQPQLTQCLCVMVYSHK